MKRVLLSCCAAVLSAAMAASAEERTCGRVADLAVSPRAFDERSGQDLYRYPRDPLVEYRHLRLRLRFEDLSDPSFAGEALYTLRAVAPGVRSVTLDAVDYLDLTVAVDGRPAEFTYDDRQITILFDADLAIDRDTAVDIAYRVVDPDAGLIFVPPDPAYRDRPVSLHTQGQTETNRYWFPCHDSPNVRFTTEMLVTVPRPFIAVSNGRLLERREDPGGRHWTFHWKQDVPHVAYLTSLAVADFDVQHDMVRDIPVEYYVPQAWAADTRRTFERTPEMIVLFEELTGVPYPYSKYAQVVVPNFESGGMENISASTLTETCMIDERAALDQDSDGLIAHELAHQWYGDLLTCRTWAHVWLNEGFASFMDEVWFEHWKGQDWYQTAFRHTYRRVAEADSPRTPGPMVFRDYESTWEPFGHKGGMPYSKGSSVLAMLRHMLGEEIFWRGLRTYTQRYAGRLVETDDFRRVMEEVSGRTLEQFFEQYCYRPGTPTISVEYRWDAEKKEAVVEFKQTQHIDRRTPAFVVPIDLYFAWEGGVDTVTFQLEKRSDAYRRKFSSQPTMFCVDPHAGLLAKLEVKMPRGMRVRLLKDGPTAVARMDAARDLAEHTSPDVVAGLTACLSREEEFWRVRSAAADSLGRIRTDAARDALLAALTEGKGIVEPRVRRAAVDALGNYRYDDLAVAALVRFARGDPSYGVEQTATRALGRVRAHGAIDVIVENLERPSRYDRLLLAALEALAELEDNRGLEPAIKTASYGSAYRTRPRAIGLLPRFVGDDDAARKRVRDALVRMLDDPQPSALRAAIRALGELGDTQAIGPLQQRARQRGARGRLTEESLRKLVHDAVDQIRSRTKESPAVRSLREETREMRKELDELRRRMEKLDRAESPTTAPAVQDDE
jgi:aminopeptidase N